MLSLKRRLQDLYRRRTNFELFVLYPICLVIGYSLGAYLVDAEPKQIEQQPVVEVITSIDDYTAKELLEQIAKEEREYDRMFDRTTMMFHPNCSRSKEGYVINGQVVYTCESFILDEIERFQIGPDSSRESEWSNE